MVRPRFLFACCCPGLSSKFRKSYDCQEKMKNMGLLNQSFRDSSTEVYLWQVLMGSTALSGIAFIPIYLNKFQNWDICCIFVVALIWHRRRNQQIWIKSCVCILMFAVALVYVAFCRMVILIRNFTHIISVFMFVSCWLCL